MKPSRSFSAVSARLVCIGAAAAGLVTLAGCGGTSSSSSAVMPQTLGSQSDSLQGAMVTARVYASDGDGGSIYVFRQDNSKLIRQFGHFSSPVSVTTDRAGNIYVTDWGQGSYDGHVYVTAPGASKPFLTLDDTGALPNDVAVGTTGTVFVANGYDQHGCGSAGDVRVYPKGSITASYTICDSAIGQPYSQINGVAVDRRGNVFVTWQNNRNTGGRVREFTPGPNFTGHFLPPFFKYPSAVAIDSSGNVVVSDVEAPAVEVFSPDGKTLKYAFARTGDPLHVAFDSTEQHLYVADAIANQIDEYDYASGTLVKAIAFPGSQLDGVAISPRDR